MCFFRKRKGKIVKKIDKERSLIEENVTKMGKLLVVFENVPDIVKEIEKIRQEYRYVSPHAAKATAKKDEKISDYLDDLHIRAKKAEKHEDYDDIHLYLKKIRLAMTER